MMKKSREKQLVIQCARTHMDEERTHKVRSLLEGRKLDWDYILNHRAFYRVTPLLFHNLKGIAGKDAVPLSVMDALTARYAFIFYRNMRIYDILREVLEKFRDDGIPVILLKGVALGETVYSNIDLRPPGDIDLLVRKTDLRKAAEILSGIGYTPSHPIEEYMNHHHIPPYAKLDEKLDQFISIEIHHNIAPEPLMSRIKAEDLWIDARIANIVGLDVLVLSPENLILHLCIHLSNGYFVNGMGNLVDISESIRYYNGKLDWDSIVARSNNFRVGSFAYYPLSLAKEMIDADIPSCVLKGLKLCPELKPSMVKLLRTIIGRNIFANQNSRFHSSSINLLYTLLCRGFFGKSLVSYRSEIAGETWVRAFDSMFQRCIRKNSVMDIL